MRVTVNNCDDKLLQQARNFDRAALTAVYDQYHPLLYRYIIRQVNDAETARELTAVVFERFLAALKNGNGPETQLKAWLYRTAHNLVIDHYRRQGLLAEVDGRGSVEEVERRIQEALADE